jgi:hypothetical protein
MPELEDRRISAAYKPNDRPERRSGHARLLEALAVAVLTIGFVMAAVATSLFYWTVAK